MNKRKYQRKYPVTREIAQYLRKTYDPQVWGRCGQIAEALDWPVWAVKQAASELGLTCAQNHRPWTPKEEEFLRIWVGVRCLRWLARKLGRSAVAVKTRLIGLRLRQRIRFGYTIKDVAIAFGVAPVKINQWIDRGWLTPTRTTPHEYLARISELELAEFVRKHRDAYDLKRVHQEWFLRLVFDGPAAIVDMPAEVKTARRHQLRARLPPEPTDAEPGTSAKLAVLRDRYTEGVELWHAEDKD